MATKSILYTLTSGQWKRWDGAEFVRYKTGDVISGITGAEYQEHKWRLREVSQESIDKAAETDAKLKALLTKSGKLASAEADDEDYDWAEILSGSTAVIKEYLVSVLDSVEMVESLLAAEMEGQNRKGVVTAANERLVALSNSKRVGEP